MKGAEGDYGPLLADCHRCRGAAGRDSNLRGRSFKGGTKSGSLESSNVTVGRTDLGRKRVV